MPSEIKAYTFLGHLYHPDCIIAEMTREDGEYDGWGLAPGVPYEPVEKQLDDIAYHFGIDREAHDIELFPLPVTVVMPWDTCEHCGELIGEED